MAGTAPTRRSPQWLAPTRPKPGAVLTEALDEARASVGRAGAVAGTSLSNEDLTAAAQQLAALTSQVQALSLAVLAEARDRGRRGPAEDAADPDVVDWWGRLTGDPAEVLRGGLWVARLLKTTYDRTRTALEDGSIRLSQAKVIVRAAERAPSSLTREQVAEAEASLVAAASGAGTRDGRPMAAGALRAEARRTFAGMLPTKAEADQAEGDDLEAQERRAERETYLSLHDRGDGTWRGSVVLPDLHARLLQATLEHLTRPRRHARDGAGEAVVDDSADVTGPSYGERLGSAFCELLEHLPTTGFGPSGIALLVRIDLDQLMSGHGAATLDTGMPVSAGEARRAACNAGHVPVVLGGDSRPVDVGLSRRLFTGHQSHAMAAIHDTCAIAGCSRPFTWCELHHLREWSRGGPTDLDNGVPLCGYHHRRAHDGDFDLTRHRGHEFRLRRKRRR